MLQEISAELLSRAQASIAGCADDLSRGLTELEGAGLEKVLVHWAQIEKAIIEIENRTPDILSACIRQARAHKAKRASAEHVAKAKANRDPRTRAGKKRKENEA